MEDKKNFKKNFKKELQKDLKLMVYDRISCGETIKQICQALNLSWSNISYYLSSLKKEGTIRKIGYGVWEALPTSTGNQPPKFEVQGYHPETLKRSLKFQLHDLSFVVRLVSVPLWWKNRGNWLVKVGFKGISEVSWGNNRFSQVEAGGFLVQCFSTSLIFISKQTYDGDSVWDCFDQSVRHFLDALAQFERLADFKFFLEGVPQVRIRSSHYVLLRDAVAKHCVKSGEGFDVVVDGKRRMWVDFSLPLGMEAGHKDFAVEDMEKYADVVKDYLTMDHYKPSELKVIVDALSESYVNLSKSHVDLTKELSNFFVILPEYSENIRTHIQAIRELSAIILGERRRFKKMERILKGQKRLTEWEGFV